jgi:hypothetical protein
MSVTVKLDTSKLTALIASVPAQAEKLTKDAAFLIEQGAKLNIMNWPLIDTGALYNSIQAQQDGPAKWVIGDLGGYHGSRPSRFGERSTKASMEYAVFWELGHRNIFKRRYMRMPFLGPAVVAVENKFTDMIAKGLIK